MRSHCEVASETAKYSVMVRDCHLAAHTTSLNTVVLSTGYFGGGSSPGGSVDMTSIKRKLKEA